MADAGSFNADLGMNIQFNIDGAGLTEMTKTIKEISKGKDLQRYWKDVESATNNAVAAIKEYKRDVNSQDLATDFLKQINALKAITKKENLSEIFPDMKIDFNQLVESAKKVAPLINSEFSSSKFEQAFNTFDLLKEKGIELEEVFKQLSSYSKIVQENLNLNRENRTFRNLIGDKDIEKIKKDLSEIQHLRKEAEKTFTNFLKVNNIEKTDYWGNERFSDYFSEIRNGTMTATKAITQFKTEYAYLLEESFKANNNTFGLEQLQAFSTTLDSIFRQVEETSLKINDIISNGVIAKSVQNLSTDTALSDSQRSLFGNLLQDEESLKSITTLFQKLIEESNQTKNTEMFNSEQFVKIEELFTNIESHLSSIKSVLVDVGDGEELSPLLKQLDNIREATSNIKLSLNLDFGNEISEKLNQKISQVTTRQLEAYRKLFSAMKGTGKTNKEMLNFYEPENASTTELIGMYQSVIKRARNHFKVGDNDIYEKLLGSTYKDLNREIDNASRQLSNAENKRPDSGILRDLFGNSKDLSGIVEQLNIIVSKLDEISISATKFSEVFKDGLNITTSVEEITTLTNKVKELETELERVKSVSATTTTSSTSTQKTNISSGKKDAFPKTSENLEQVAQSEQKVQQEAVATDKALDNISFTPNTKGFDEVLSKLDLAKSKLSEITKISIQGHRNADGKFNTSYILRDKNGSTETYGESSKGEKGQLLTHNYVQYDANATKRIIEENIRLNKNYYDSKAKDEAEYQKLRAKYIAEGLRQEQQVYQEYNKDWESAIEFNKKFDNALADTEKRLINLSIPKELEKDWLKLIDYADELRVKLANSEINLPEYNKLINSKIGKYNSNVNIQQKRDKETFDTAAKEQENKLLDRQKQIWNELTTSLDRYASLQKRIASNNALSTDVEEAETLKSHIDDLKKRDILPKDKLNIVDEKLQQINQTVADLKAKLKESTLDSLQGSIDKYRRAYNNYSVRPANEQSDAYKNALINLNSAIQELEKYKATLSGMSEVTENQEAHIEKLVSECAKASDAFKQMSASQKGAKEIGIAKSIQRINKDLAENTRYSKTAKQNLQALLNQLESGDPSINLEKINSEIIKIENAEIRAGRAGKSFLDIFKTKAVHGFLGQAQSYLSMYIGFYGMVNKVRSTITTVKELDTALVDLKKTTTMTEQQLNKFYYSSNNVARQMGVTTQEIIEQASAWSRLGYSSNEAATEMAKLSSQFASISPGMDTDESQSGLVSIMKAWSINPDDVKSQIMDPINKLGNTMAESNLDIVEGMERSAAALAAVGTSVQDGLAMFSGIQEVLQNAEKSGTALRSVALRIRSFDESTEEYSDDLANITGELIDLTKTAEHAEGVSIFKPGSTTEFKDLTDYFGEIADIWDEMSQKQQNDFLIKAFGKNQAQAGAALIQNYKGVAKALDEIDNSAGSSDQEMQTIEKSLEYKANNLKQIWVGVAQDIADRGDLGTLIDSLSSVSEFLGTIVGKLGLLKTAVLGVAAVASIKNFGKCV